jgi:hypothetical protein
MKQLANALSDSGEGGEGKMVGVFEPVYKECLFRIFMMNPPCTTNIS